MLDVCTMFLSSRDSSDICYFIPCFYDQPNEYIRIVTRSKGLRTTWNYLKRSVYSIRDPRVICESFDVRESEDPFI